MPISPEQSSQESPERDILREVEDAGNWLEAELRKIGTPEETIETRCNLFGQMVFLVLMHAKDKKTPMALAQSYFEQFKGKETKE